MPRDAKPATPRGGRAAGTPGRRNAGSIVPPAAAGMLPHEILLAVARGEAVGDHTPTFEERVEAAKAAAPYYAPKLSTVKAQVTGADGGPLRHSIEVRFAEPDEHAGGHAGDRGG